jgi:hypothetical protein
VIKLIAPLRISIVRKPFIPKSIAASVPSLDAWKANCIM